MMNDSFFSLAGPEYKVSYDEFLKILEQVRISADKQILLVKLQSHMYLIGVSQAGIQLLEKLEEEYKEPEEREETDE